MVSFNCFSTCQLAMREACKYVEEKLAVKVMSLGHFAECLFQYSVISKYFLNQIN